MNVGNCGHACEARPCGDAECRPLRERFTCRCRPGVPHPCPAPDKISPTSAPALKNDTPSAFKHPDKTVPSFTGSDSYLHYNDADTMKRWEPGLFILDYFFPFSHFRSTFFYKFQKWKPPKSTSTCEKRNKKLSFHLTELWNVMNKLISNLRLWKPYRHQIIICRCKQPSRVEKGSLNQRPPFATFCTIHLISWRSNILSKTIFTTSPSIHEGSLFFWFDCAHFRTRSVPIIATDRNPYPHG